MASRREAPLDAGASRALAASLEIVGVSAAGHAAAGGVLPDPGYLLGLAAVVFLASLATVTRFLHVGLVIGVVSAAQAGLHLAFADLAAPMQGAYQMSGGTPMLGVHALAAVMTALVLLLQSQAVARISAWIDRLSGGLSAQPIPLLGVRAARGGCRCRRRLLLAAAPRRGPPLGALLTT